MTRERDLPLDDTDSGSPRAAKLGGVEGGVVGQLARCEDPNHLRAAGQGVVGRCCNPAHLEAVTATEHVRRRRRRADSNAS
jgi:hypothetical protein